MILIALFGLGLAAGLLRGGKLRNLASLRLRHAWLPLLAFGLQACFVVFGREPASIPTWVRIFVLLITFAGLIGFLLSNRHLPGGRLLLAGAALNAIVMLANGGFMPVTPQALARSGHSGYIVAQGGDQFVRRSKDIVLEKEETRLWFLSDVIGIPAPLPFSSNFSPGDLVIGLGAAWLTYRGLTRRAGAAEGGSSAPSGAAERKSGGRRRLGRGIGNGAGSDAQDDRPCADRPAVSGGPAEQSAGGHA
jgi:hypothetical protein